MPTFILALIRTDLSQFFFSIMSIYFICGVCYNSTKSYGVV